MVVAYGGGRTVIRVGRRYYADSFDRALIGWHGTYDPPLDMGGSTLVASATSPIPPMPGPPARP